MKKILTLLIGLFLLNSLFIPCAFPDNKFGQLDPNEASEEQLQNLYLVGRKRARAIIKEREANGPFTSLWDLSKRVKGIGPIMIQKWEPYVILPLGDEEDEKEFPPIDINTATEEELLRLYRVGEVLAKRIIEEREKNGPYSSLEELSWRVKGIGPTLTGQWKGKVTNQLSNSYP